MALCNCILTEQKEGSKEIRFPRLIVLTLINGLTLYKALRKIYNGEIRVIFFIIINDSKKLTG